jgi:hypothetical protein
LTADSQRRAAIVALLLLAPSIPELLTGSTPITRLVTDPLGFGVSYAIDIGLYGTGALLIRETSIVLRKGWASILLWGAAYGVAEEGLAVHTFFERSGPPVGALTVYGSAHGVDWLWALGLTGFHATYSIALPILLTYLWFPTMKGRRWLGRPGLVVSAVVYLAVVVEFARLVGHGPTPAELAGTLALEALLLALGAWAPANLLRVRRGPSRLGPWALGVAGSLEWAAWFTVLVVSGPRPIPAEAAAGLLLLADALAVTLVLWGVGSERLERSQFDFAAGMLIPLCLWGFLVESTVPGVLGVSAVFAYLLVRLHRTLRRREAGELPGPGPAPTG